MESCTGSIEKTLYSHNYIFTYLSKQGGVRICEVLLYFKNDYKIKNKCIAIFLFYDGIGALNVFDTRLHHMAGSIFFIPKASVSVSALSQEDGRGEGIATEAAWEHVRSLYQSTSSTCLFGKNNIMVQPVS